MKNLKNLINMRSMEKRFQRIRQMVRRNLVIVCCTSMMAMPSLAANVSDAYQDVLPQSVGYLPRESGYLNSPVRPEELLTYGHVTNVEDHIRVIRNMYQLTNATAEPYSSWQYYAYAKEASKVVKAIKKTGDNDLDRLMHHYGYSRYTIEFYYDNPNYSGPRLCYGPNFIYAVIDGKEYRYYFTDNQMIRRIGPDGSSDNPETNDFMNQLYKLGWTYQYV